MRVFVCIVLASCLSSIAAGQDAKRGDNSDRVQKLESQVAELQKQLAQTKARLLAVERKLQVIAAVASGKGDEIEGKVSWVNQKMKVVWINLGTADHLRPMTTFRVLRQSDGKGPAAEIGKIEVSRILDKHLAEARILQDDDKNPILPGDVLKKADQEKKPPVPGVNCIVTAVSDKGVVELSVGSDDGLAAGHRLVVYREKNYLGRIEVVATSPDRSVARILNELRKGDIRKGDSATTKIDGANSFRPKRPPERE